MNKYKKATFAGGCFWCMQHPFDSQRGVISTRVGYTGGHKENPTYDEVCSGTSEHAEAIEITYDPKLISYQDLLAIFWRNIDPTARDRQFADSGTQYRTAIYYHDREQQTIAVESKKELEQSGKFKNPIVTGIAPAEAFYPAEEYHQEYYKKNPARYKFYLQGSGRKKYIEEKWPDK